ncbi:MAG: hypothetical protein U0840_03950 [Gemmataceae bacterium]
MSHSRYPLTPIVEQQIVAYLRAGGSLEAAAEAAGIPDTVFRAWLTRPGPRYRRFADAVRTAHAQARLRGEIAVLEARPLDWLKSGPGRDRSDHPGWSAAPRASATGTDRPLLDDPLLQRMLALLVQHTQENSTAGAAARALLDEPGDA